MADAQRSTPSEEVRRLFEESETRTGKAFEEVVSRGSFGELLARMTENAVALTKISTDVFDLTLRNMRLAGRQDVVKLSRQLSRTEDKLELVLQHIEELEDELRSAREEAEPRGGRRNNRSRRGGSTNGAPGNGGRRRAASAQEEQ
ncbi:MAG: hypothetical protein JO372_20130 [Solirubrobacterales bacterium]|nr:hypothetical protein [Solirubrobacterales bacterium]